MVLSETGRSLAALESVGRAGRILEVPLAPGIVRLSCLDSKLGIRARVLHCIQGVVCGCLVHHSSWSGWSAAAGRCISFFVLPCLCARIVFALRAYCSGSSCCASTAGSACRLSGDHGHRTACQACRRAGKWTNGATQKPNLKTRKQEASGVNSNRDVPPNLHCEVTKAT